MAIAAPLAGPSHSGNNNNGKANGEFLKDGRWKEVFIPTLTHALYTSREPFLDWTSDSSTLLANVQEIFDLTFTNVDLSLSSKDLVTTTVRRVHVLIPSHSLVYRVSNHQ